jgi:hypothetical protein
MRKYLRYLRIFWTVFCGIACVLLIALWVRSYWYCDTIDRMSPSTIQTTIGSNCGRVYLIQMDMRPLRSRNTTPHDWTYKGRPAMPPDRKHWVRWVHKTGVFETAVSHWFVITPAAVLAVAPWILWSKRFSLRTLLIATTLVAVVLGMAVYASR